MQYIAQKTLIVDTYWQGKHLSGRWFHSSHRSLAEWYMRKNEQRGFDCKLREV